VTLLRVTEISLSSRLDAGVEVLFRIDVESLIPKVNDEPGYSNSIRSILLVPRPSPPPLKLDQYWCSSISTPPSHSQSLNRELGHPPVYDQRPGIGPHRGIAGDQRLQRLLQIKASGVVTWRWSVRKPRTVQHDRFVGLFVKESRDETRKRWTWTKVCR
jgi:hypothetical protein